MSEWYTTIDELMSEYDEISHFKTTYSVMRTGEDDMYGGEDPYSIFTENIEIEIKFHIPDGWSTERAERHMEMTQSLAADITSLLGKLGFTSDCEDWGWSDGEQINNGELINSLWTMNFERDLREHIIGLVYEQSEEIANIIFQPTMSGHWFFVQENDAGTGLIISELLSQNTRQNPENYDKYEWTVAFHCGGSEWDDVEIGTEVEMTNEWLVNDWATEEGPPFSIDFPGGSL